MRRSPANKVIGCHAGLVPTTAETSTCLVELVLSAGEFGPQAEPALRELRAALEAYQDQTSAPDGSALSPILRTGMAVTQEFGKLDITLRALVSTDDLLLGARLGAEHLRGAVTALDDGDRSLPASFQEQSVRASWS